MQIIEEIETINGVQKVKIFINETENFYHVSIPFETEVDESMSYTISKKFATIKSIKKLALTFASVIANGTIITKEIM